MKRWLVLVLLVAPLFAQQENPNERIQKLVQLKYADPGAIELLLMNFGVERRSDARLRVIALSGPRSNVTTAEAAIKQLDVPSAAQKDIDLTVYFLVGTDAAATSIPPGATVPQDLQSTVAALKTAFPFKVYYLLDALALQTRSGRGASATGQLNGGRFTSFQVGSADVEGDGSMIRLERLHAGLQIPRTSGMLSPTGDTRKVDYTNTGVTTDIVDVKEGQKLVVGRSSLDGPNTALFLVLIAKVVN